MMKGISLEQDFRKMVNNPKYSDIEIICQDKKKLHGSRAILAARSEMFDKLLYNGMKETYEKEITMPEINSFAMETILEYIYTGKIKEDSLNKDNTIEVFFAADYFNLPELQKCIVQVVKDTLERNYTDNFSPELLSRLREKTEDDNILLNSLAESVAVIPLNTLEIGRLSIAGLRYLLEYTYQKDFPFATTEYDVFRYSAILTAKQISDDAYEALKKRLLTSKSVDTTDNDDDDDDNDDDGRGDDNDNDEAIIDRDRIADELEPLTKYIEFKRISGKVIHDIIDPLEIVPMKLLYEATKYQSKHGNILSDTRGTAPSLYMFTESDCVWNESDHGSLISIEDDGKVLESSYSELQSARANIICCKGFYEWDIIIEKYCTFTWIGVCSAESRFDFNGFAGAQSNVWILGSSDTTNRTIAFTINGKRYSEISILNSPSKLYPIVSICSPGRIRIQPHRKKSS
ncbi:hypothetical protein GLOIN_2v1656935 [Rhizophagus clarus]|uniref:BTB domain-containing protein n=1 Tax=Rhizophagus clarus TaxID=94130 RepID=A0A8H3M3S6_9GLOM|nr:hypothetical protein GLOIN_2v1656935 [Rhizophagus clarus]